MVDFKLMLRQLARRIYHSYLRKVKFRNKYTSNGRVDFSNSSDISLSHGSTKENIILDDECRMYGHLITQNGGTIIMHGRSKIGFGSKIMCSNRVEIGENTGIAENTKIVDNNNHPVHPKDREIMRKSPYNSPLRSWKYSDSAPIVIGKNVWIGSDVRICKGVTIGDGSVIAANSVVTKSCPPNCIMGGNPAKILRENIDLVTHRYFKDA